VKPYVAAMVVYTLTEQDAQAINLRRSDHDSYRAKHAAAERVAGEPGATGHQAHAGNQVRAGDQFPAVIVAIWGPESVNLQVLLDGNDTYWATSRRGGGLHGEWQWPTPGEREPGDRPARF
jgi:hypothetical protein